MLFRSAIFLLVTRLNGTGDVDAARRAFDGFPEDTKSRLIGPGQRGYGTGADISGAVLGIGAYL